MHTSSLPLSSIYQVPPVPVELHHQPGSVPCVPTQQVVGAVNPVDSSVRSLGEYGSVFRITMGGVPQSRANIIEVMKAMKIAQDPAELPLNRLAHALITPKTLERDAVLNDLFLNHLIDCPSNLANCILGMSNLKVQQELLNQYQQAGKDLQAIISEADEKTQPRLLNILPQHPSVLLSLIADSRVSIKWRLIYTFLLPAEVFPGEKESAYQNTFEAGLNVSALELLSLIESVVNTCPKSSSRNPMIQRFINARDKFTSGQRITLLHLMGESVQKDDFIQLLIQEEAFFNLEQRTKCVEAMSEGPQKDALLKQLNQQIAEAAAA